MSTVKMTTYHLANLLEKMTSTDKDYRFMATNDLMSELQKDNIILDDDSEKKVVRMLLKLLEDNNGEVQNLAVRCMGPLVSKVKPDQVENVVECLCTNMLSDKEQLRDISSIGLKTVLTEISPAPSAMLSIVAASTASSQSSSSPAGSGSPQSSQLPATIVKKITPRLITAIAQEDVAVQLEALDILADLLMRFGPLLVPYHVNILDALEPLLASNRLAVRKRSIICLAQLTLTCQTTLYTRLIDFLMDALESDAAMSTARTYVQSIGAICRSSGHRFGMYLDRVLPLILGFCRAGAAGTINGDARAEGEDDELRENCLQACESFTRTCPKSMQPHVDALIDICLQYLVYDPNYNYGDEDEDDNGMDDGRSKESMDWNDEEEAEDDDEDEEYSDDDDMSWKVRRAAAKCLEAIVATDCACLPLFLSKVAPRLISRFKEREENVKVDILHVYTTMLKQLPRAAVMSGIVSGMTDDQMETEGALGSPQQLLLAQVPALVRSLQRQLKEKGVRTRQACLLLLTELVTVAPGCLDSHIPTLIPGVLYSLADKTTVSSMRMDTLSFLYRLLSASSPQAFHPHISTLLPPVIQAIGDGFYKITSEALLVTQQLVKVMRPIGVASEFDFTPFVDGIYRATLNRLKASDIDQEVKERAISCMGVILSHMGDRLTGEMATCLPIFLDRLRNEITRLSTVKALNEIASSPLGIDLRSILDDALPILASFLRKNQRALKLSTLLLLNTIVHNYKHALTVQSLHQVMVEFPPLLNESDLHVAQLTLNLLTSIGVDHKPALAETERLGILHDVRNLLRSPLLQGSALEAMLNFFRTLVAAGLPGLGFTALLTSLFQFVQNPGRGSLNRQASHNVAKCVSALVMVEPQEALSVVGHLLGDVKRPKSDNVHVFALLAIGEIGRHLDLSAVPGLRETLLANLSSPSEEVKGAASYAVGLTSLSNLNASVPFLLSEIRGGTKRQYLLLHALKEVIVNLSATTAGIAALHPFVSDVWALLFAHAETAEEGMRNVVAECLGRLTLSDPGTLLPELKKQLHHQNAYMRSTVITAIKFTISDQPQRIDSLLKDHLGDFMVLLDDENLSVRRVALVAFNSAAHNKPLLIKGLLPDLLPRLYRETDIRQDLIREVEMGPFKHTVDDGLDLRKAAFECMYTLLDSPGLLPHLNLDAFLDRVDAGLRDHHDIKMLTYLMLSRMAYLAPHSVLARLDRLVEPLKSTCLSKARAMSVKQECEKLDELKRAALRVVVALQNMQDADKNPHLSDFMTLIMSSKELRDLYDTVQKDAISGPGAGAGLGNAASSLWVQEMDSSPAL